jgi:hypothetical protein
MVMKANYVTSVHLAIIDFRTVDAVIVISLELKLKLAAKTAFVSAMKLVNVLVELMLLDIVVIVAKKVAFRWTLIIHWVALSASVLKNLIAVNNRDFIGAIYLYKAERSVLESAIYKLNIILALILFLNLLITKKLVQIMSPTNHIIGNCLKNF